MAVCPDIYRLTLQAECFQKSTAARNLSKVTAIEINVDLFIAVQQQPHGFQPLSQYHGEYFRIIYMRFQLFSSSFLYIAISFCATNCSPKLV